MDDNMSNPSEAPRWWCCDTHGPGNPNVLGCPNCVAELRRWKSTNAPRLEVLAELLSAAQKEAHAAREAIATLTEEVRKANAECNVLAWWMVEALGVLCDVDADAEDGGESLRMLKESGDRLVAAVFRQSQRIEPTGPRCNLQRPWEQPE